MSLEYAAVEASEKSFADSLLRYSKTIWCLFWNAKKLVAFSVLFGKLLDWKPKCQAHNLKFTGSNPAPVTNAKEHRHTAILPDGGFSVP